MMVQNINALFYAKRYTFHYCPAVHRVVSRVVRGLCYSLFSMGRHTCGVSETQIDLMLPNNDVGIFSKIVGVYSRIVLIDSICVTMVIVGAHKVHT